MVKKPSPNTDQRRRSLLQKAVRRGYGSLVHRVALSLDRLGDANWIRQRTAVIIFEECWPLGSEINTPLKLPDAISLLIKASKTVKAKDAAGLGSLAYAYSEGDNSVLPYASDNREMLNLLTRAIQEPERFWNWAEGECTEEVQRKIVSGSRQAFRKGGWPWDKAFMLAGALLAVRGEIPAIHSVPDITAEEFPFWIALDKHTPEGKETLRKIARELRLPVNQVMWASFYCESALTNESIGSPWWEAERTWRLRKYDLTEDSAFRLWEKIQPFMIEYLSEEAQRLKDDFAEEQNDDIPPHSLIDSKGHQLSLPGFGGE